MKIPVLEQLIKKTAVTVFRPFCFFPAYSGVLTLAFTGFPEPIVKLKNNIERKMPFLRPENPGSRWPKITLGAVNDGKRLKPKDIYVIKEICERLNRKLNRQDLFCPVSNLSFVYFSQRNLEKIIFKETVPFTGNPRLRIRRKESDYVKRIVSEFSSANLSAYIPRLTDGKNTASSYTQTDVQATLVWFLDDSIFCKKLLRHIRIFKKETDEALPGLYRWFSAESYHITIRALV